MRRRKVGAAARSSASPTVVLSVTIRFTTSVKPMPQQPGRRRSSSGPTGPSCAATRPLAESAGQKPLPGCP